MVALPAALLSSSLAQFRALTSPGGSTSAQADLHVIDLAAAGDATAVQRLRALAHAQLATSQRVPMRVLAPTCALSACGLCMQQPEVQRLHLVQRPVPRGASLGQALRLHIGEGGEAALRRGECSAWVHGLRLPLAEEDASDAWSAAAFDMCQVLAGADGWLEVVILSP